MKILIVVPTIFIFCLFCFAVCEDKCWGRVCAEPISFKLLDKLTQQDLVFGTIPRYTIDSMQLNRSPDFTLGYHMNHLSNINTIGYNYLVISTGRATPDTTYLRLAYNDIDTLIITYAYEQKDCCDNFGGYGKITSIKYNGVIATKDSLAYKFEKQ